MSSSNNSAFLQATGVFTNIRDLKSKDDETKLWKRTGQFAVLGFTIDVDFPEDTTLSTPKPGLHQEGVLNCSLAPHYKGGVSFVVNSWSPAK